MKKLFLDVFRPVRDILVKRPYRQLYFSLSRLLYLERYKQQSNLKILDYRFDIPDGPSAFYSYKELFCDEIYAFPAKKTNPIIIDCGSNIGFSIAYFKTLFPDSRIIAIEADKKIFEFLKKNILRNNFANVELVNKAVWVHNNGVTFHSEGADGGFIDSVETDQKISSIKLRELISAFSLVDLLKIDIEGAEFEVIKDCDGFLDKVDNIFIEYHSKSNQPQQLGEMLSILAKNGFRYDIQDLYKKKHPFLRFLDKSNFDLQLNIFCKKTS